MPPSAVIEGIKLIRHNAGNVNEPDDPSFPFRLEVNCRPPEFMDFAFVMLHGGSEELVLHGMTKEVIDEFIEKNNLRTHSRLRSFVITGPEGIVEQFPLPKDSTESSSVETES